METPHFLLPQCKGGARTSGGGSDVVTHTKKLNTKDHIITLRSAIFNCDGSDKDPCAAIAPGFMKYDRNGLDLTLESKLRLSAAERNFAFKLTKANMEELYEASGYGWSVRMEYKPHRCRVAHLTLCWLSAWPTALL